MITPADVSLDGMVAIVTGGARGLGRAIALGLASFGATVAVCDRDADEQAETVAALRSLGRASVAEILDVRDADAVAAFVQHVVDAHGRVDVLVNNAAGTFYAHFADTSPKGVATMVDENFQSKVPLDWGEPDDCAGAAVYLASRLAKWITGTVLHVDGGAFASSGWSRREDGTYEP